MKPWALITGASEGIGRELAVQLAANGGYALALVARNEARLNELAALLAKMGTETRVLAGDLGQPEFSGSIQERLKGGFVEVLINNAGFGSHGEFAELALAREIAMLRVNCEALMRLTHVCLGPMRQAGRGRILNVASTAAFQPGPFMAAYYASKAFVFSFSEALREELRGTGVTVTTLCPGLTRTEFSARAGMKGAVKRLRAMSAERVARAGLDGMSHGKAVVIPGLLNYIMVVVSRRLPVGLTSRVVRKLNGY